MEIDEEYLSTREAAKRLNVSLRTVQLWVENGTLQAWKTVGGHRRISQGSVNDYVKKREVISNKKIKKKQLVMVMVDDDEEILDAYSESISLSGLPIQLITAKNGYEGLLKIGEYKPDLIMTDLMMPTMDGYEMLKAINLDENNSEIFIVTAVDTSEVYLKDVLKKRIKLFQKPLMFESLEDILIKNIKDRVDV